MKKFFQYFFEWVTIKPETENAIAQLKGSINNLKTSMDAVKAKIENLPPEPLVPTTVPNARQDQLLAIGSNIQKIREEIHYLNEKSEGLDFIKWDVRNKARFDFFSTLISLFPTIIAIALAAYVFRTIPSLQRKASLQQRLSVEASVLVDSVRSRYAARDTAGVSTYLGSLEMKVDSLKR